MCRFKKWLTTKYLPAYAKTSMSEQEAFYQKEIRRLQNENDSLRAYINGLEKGVKALRKIEIYNGRGD